MTQPFRRVTPKPDERYRTCVPLIGLEAAAGAWRAQEGVPEPEDPNVEWVTWDGSRRFAKDMFVARVAGRSMEPLIPDGAYCLFRRVALPSSPERAVLVRHAGAASSETGGQYTVKHYREGKDPDGERQVVLEPANAAFAPIVITSPGVDDVRVIAEVVEILGLSDDTRETRRDAARESEERPNDAKVPKVQTEVTLGERAWALREALAGAGIDARAAARESRAIFVAANDLTRTRWIDLELTGYGARPERRPLHEILGLPAGAPLIAEVAAYRTQVGRRWTEPHGGSRVAHFFVEPLAELYAARDRVRIAKLTGRVELAFLAPGGAFDYPKLADFPTDIFEQIILGFVVALRRELGEIAP
jgi:hypothetical protein